MIYTDTRYVHTEYRCYFKPVRLVELAKNLTILSGLATSEAVAASPLYSMADAIGLSHPQDQLLANLLITAKSLIPLNYSQSSSVAYFETSQIFQLGSFNSAFVIIDTIIAGVTLTRLNYPIAIVPNMNKHAVWSSSSLNAASFHSLLKISTTAQAITVYIQSQSGGSITVTAGGVIAVLS